MTLVLKRPCFGMFWGGLTFKNWESLGFLYIYTLWLYLPKIRWGFHRAIQMMWWAACRTPASVWIPLWFHNQTYAYVPYIQITHMSYVYIYIYGYIYGQVLCIIKKYHISKTTHIQKNVYFRYMFNLRTTCHGMLTKKLVVRPMVNLPLHLTD